MQDTTIVVPGDLLDRLRRLAAERETSVEALVREALEEKADSRRPKPRSLGMGDSGRTDIARRIGEEGFVPEPWR
jgi:hypothetical protein